MASLSLYPQFETNLMSNSKVTELLLQLKSAKAHGKNYIRSNHTWSTIFCVIEGSKSYGSSSERQGKVRPQIVNLEPL